MNGIDHHGLNLRIRFRRQSLVRLFSLRIFFGILLLALLLGSGRLDGVSLDAIVLLVLLQAPTIGAQMTYLATVVTRKFRNLSLGEVVLAFRSRILVLLLRAHVIGFRILRRFVTCALTSMRERAFITLVACAFGIESAGSFRGLSVRYLCVFHRVVCTGAVGVNAQLIDKSLGLRVRRALIAFANKLVDAPFDIWKAFTDLEKGINLAHLINVDSLQLAGAHHLKPHVHTRKINSGIIPLFGYNTLRYPQKGIIPQGIIPVTGYYTFCQGIIPFDATGIIPFLR